MISDLISSSEVTDLTRVCRRGGWWCQGNAALGKHTMMSPPPQPGVNTLQHVTCHSHGWCSNIAKYQFSFSSSDKESWDVWSGICEFDGKCILRREPKNCLDYNFLWLISDHFDSGLYQDEKLSGSWHFSIKIWICKNSQNSTELGFACTADESHLR